MRENFARAVTAALLTGSIATVVAMSALLGATSRPAKPPAVPPSASQRVVQLEPAALRPQRRPPARKAQVVRDPVVRRAPRPIVVVHRIVVRHRHSVPVRRRRLATVEPKPAPAPTPAPAPAPVPEVAPAPAVDDQGSEEKHGNGHAYGHDKNGSKGQKD